jgi:O-antigen/teichoic acid export membrane protein
MNNLLRHSKLLIPYSALIVNIIIGFVFTPFLINTLGERVYGSYVGLVSVLSVLSVLEFGMNNSLLRFLSVDENKIIISKEKIMFFFLLFYVFISFLVFIGGILFFRFDNSIFYELNETNNFLLIYYFLILIIISNFLINFFNSVMASNGNYHITKLISTLFDILTHIFIVFGFYFVKELFVIPFITFLLGLIVYFISILKYIVLFKLQFITFYEFFYIFKKVFLYTFVSFFSSLFDKYFYPSLLIITSYFEVSLFNTFYSISFSLISYVVLFSSQISNIFFFKISRNLSLEWFNKELLKTSTIQFCFLLLLLSGFLLFGNYFLINWLGANFSIIYFLFIFLFSSRIFSMSKNIINSYLQLKNLIFFKSMVNFLSLIVSILFTFFFFDSDNALLNILYISSTSFLFQFIIMDFYYYFSLKIDVLSVLINQIKIIFLTTPVFSFFYFFLLYYPVNDILSFILNVVLYSIFFFVPIFLFRKKIILYA